MQLFSGPMKSPLKSVTMQYQSSPLSGMNEFYFSLLVVVVQKDMKSECPLALEA